MKLYLAIAIMSYMVYGCSKMDHTYRQFAKKGDQRYSKQPDSVFIFPGHNRVRAWMVVSDPNIVRSRIFWNNGSDSIEVPVDMTSKESDTVSAIIDSLDEGTYTFLFYTYDKGGNVSIEVQAIGQVYGDTYIGSLSNRLIKNASLINEKGKVLWLAESDSHALGSEIKYQDQQGNTNNIWVSLNDLETIIDEHPKGDTIQYRTLFLPDSLSIDTFYTDYQTVVLGPAVPMELDKSKFSELRLPTDAPIDKSSGPMTNLWDNILDGKSWYRTKNGTGSPHWYTIDLGVTAQLSKYTVWQRGTVSEHNLLYTNADPRVWEVWGSNDPDPDGGWNNWVKLADCESVKPSGLPLGQTSDEDIAQAQKGETFTFPENSPPVRYIRLKILETWDPKNSDHSFFSELTFYGISE